MPLVIAIGMLSCAFSDISRTHQATDFYMKTKTMSKLFVTLVLIGHKLTTYFNCEFVVAPARRLKHDDRVMIISKNKAHIGHRAHFTTYHTITLSQNKPLSITLTVFPLVSHKCHPWLYLKKLRLSFTTMLTLQTTRFRDQCTHVRTQYFYT